jgi:hypothetical protein
MDEVAQEQWNESAKTGIHSATECCNTILSYYGANSEVRAVKDGVIYFRL